MVCLVTWELKLQLEIKIQEDEIFKFNSQCKLFREGKARILKVWSVMKKNRSCNNYQFCFLLLALI